MNPDTLVQLAQKSLRVTIGATATLLETLQDPQQREANLSRLKTDLSQMTDEWEVKGESTEREARSFVDTLLSQASNRVNTAVSTEPRTVSTTVSTTAAPIAPDVQQDLQELTQQIAALRAELEKLRE
jgi:polyhydroxyalkanoate synthesis regulator phasin